MQIINVIHSNSDFVTQQHYFPHFLLQLFCPTAKGTERKGLKVLCQKNVEEWPINNTHDKSQRGTSVIKISTDLGGAAPNGGEWGEGASHASPRGHSEDSDKRKFKIFCKNVFVKTTSTRGNFYYELALHFTLVQNKNY